MTEYKKGDLVRHRPTGEYGFYDGPDHIGFGWINVCTYTTTERWFSAVCEPVTDKQPVDAGLYEAANDVFEEWQSMGHYVRGAKMAKLGNALANSKPVEQQGWITNRRPTEDDAYRGEVFAICRDGDEYADQLGFQPVGYGEIELGEPWQPVTHSLRVMPEHPKCEKCRSFQRNLDIGWSHSLFVDWCWKTYKSSPEYGMDGCVYKRRQDNDQ
jgi:hypothetical protein